jgi:uncharacterized protein (TIGR03435 family)
MEVRMIGRRASIAPIAALLSCAAFGQPGAPRPAFEVASVKPANPDLDIVENHLPNLHADRGQISFTNLQLRNLLMLAYGVGKGQISVPNSLTAALAKRYDVVAKLPANSTKEQVPLMLQRLLDERFNVTVHRENKVIPLYALVMVGNGTKLKEVPDGGGDSGCTRSFATTAGASLAADCRRMTSSDIAQVVTSLAPGYFDRPVVDMTGLTGLYDFTLEWIMRAESVNGNNGPTIFMAVERLGLKLESRKQAMDIIVVDHAENSPTEN